MDYYEEHMSETTGLEIAVIGMAGRFPGANDIHEFWNNLKNGVESVTFFTVKELEEAGIESQVLQDPNYVRARAILEGVEYFDAAFFNFTPGEAEIMDPQLRVFLECSWHALEDAGYNPDNYSGAVGVYAGNAANYYWVAKTLLSPRFHLLGKFKADMLNSQFSTRISYHLNLTGPSFTIQAACSTSLVAVHNACLGLLSSECDMALAGGVAVSHPQKSGYPYQEGMVGSPDGHCRAFDARSKGSVGGSGAGAVILKRLEDALEDGDYIYAVIKGSAVNNDGLRKVGFTTPSVKGQGAVVRAAYIMAEIDPATVSYIEAHGTGTELGDPVEIEALKMVFHDMGKNSIAIGSVKTNVGHLDAAAGITGFIKTVLALKHRQIPPTLHFETPNPKIDFENSPFYVNTKLIPWENKQHLNGEPLRAGVSAFGLGGTNAHVVLEEWSKKQDEQVEARDAAERQYRLFLLSAGTESGLEKMTENLANYLKNNSGLNAADAAYTLQVGRKAFKYRRMIVFPENGLLDAADALSKKSGKVKTFHTKVEEPPVVFLFSGQGAQYENMGLDLFENESYFREIMQRCAEIVKPLIGVDILEVLYPVGVSRSAPPAPGVVQPFACEARINLTDITQPLVFAFEYALALLLIKWGIKPTAMIGYSMGEYLAACLAGVFSLEDALKLVTARGQAMRKTPSASMLSVPLPVEELEVLLREQEGVWLAIINGPTCIVAGGVEAVTAFENRLKEKRLLCAPINIFHAVHSPLMEPIRDELINSFREVALNAPQIPYISNLSGQWITTEQATDPGYWGKHLCTTVKFSDGIRELMKEDDTVFIEIGPGRLLSNIVRHHIPEGNPLGHQVLNIVKHPQEKVSDDYFLLSKLGEFWLYGIPVNWTGFYAGEKRSRIPLPGYAFDRKRYWIEGDPFKKLTEMQFQVSANEISTPEMILPGGEEEGYRYENETYEPPRDELEENIARLWQDFLGFKRIGINVDFFEINGDSLTATQLITRLQQMYPVEISLQSFFEGPTIAQLAELVRDLMVQKVMELSEEELDNIGGFNVE
jgi:phthiocerol/phenolphthiocerol synthesis type-I polyketide synthase E